MRTVSRALTAVIFLAGLLSPVWHYGCALAGEDNQTTPESIIKIDNNTVEAPLQSVLILAMKNNLTIAFASLQPDIAETNIMREKSQFDTRFVSQYTKYREVKQVGNALSGSGSSAEIYQERYDFNTSLQKKFTLGTLAELELNHQESANDLPFSGLVPQYYGELALNITQPLLRDFGIDINTSQIRIANLNLAISEQEFKQMVIDTLFDVESSYWNLYFRIEDLKSKTLSLKLAEDLLREFKIRIDAGTLAPIEIYQAEAEVALRSEEVIVAQSLVQAAEDKLKASLNLYENERYWNLVIIPSESPQAKKITFDLNESVRVALQNRPDFRQAEINIKAADIQVKYTKNQTLPRLDLIGSLGKTGLAGRPQDTSGAFGPLFRSTPSPWKGHWDDVYDSMFGKDYYNYLLGVKIDFPLENRLARSQYSKAKVQAAQALTSLKDAENLVINDVREAIRRIDTTSKVLDSAIATLKLSEEKLKAEQKKYEVGMSTAHDVLEFQDDLARAMSTLALARTEYSKSITNHARATGLLLEHKGLKLE